MKLKSPFVHSHVFLPRCTHDSALVSVRVPLRPQEAGCRVVQGMSPHFGERRQAIRKIGFPCGIARLCTGELATRAHIMFWDQVGPIKANSEPFHRDSMQMTKLVIFQPTLQG